MTVARRSQLAALAEVVGYLGVDGRTGIIDGTEIRVRGARLLDEGPGPVRLRQDQTERGEGHGPLWDAEGTDSGRRLAQPAGRAALHARARPMASDDLLVVVYAWIDGWGGGTVTSRPAGISCTTAWNPYGSEEPPPKSRPSSASFLVARLSLSTATHDPGFGVNGEPAPASLTVRAGHNTVWLDGKTAAPAKSSGSRCGRSWCGRTGWRTGGRVRCSRPPLEPP